MTQINEYNTKVATQAEFEQWLPTRDTSKPIPENMANYIRTVVFARLDKTQENIDKLFLNIPKNAD